MSTPIPLTFTLATSRFLLRIPTEADIPFVFAATRYKGFNDGMLWDAPKSEAELHEPLARGLRAWEAGKGYAFTIQWKDSHQAVGRIAIRETAKPRRWNIGFWTHPAWQGKGVMTECVAAILAFGFETLGASSIEACYAVWNLASEKVLHRNGFGVEAHLEQGFQKQGEWVAENLCVIHHEDWESSRH